MSHGARAAARKNANLRASLSLGTTKKNAFTQHKVEFHFATDKTDYLLELSFPLEAQWVLDLKVVGNLLNGYYHLLFFLLPFFLKFQ
jgi:hypothetical protein